MSDFCYGDIPFTLPTESSKAALGADEYNLLYVALTRFTLFVHQVHRAHQVHTLVHIAMPVLTSCAGPRRT